jgi:hypothetical protein
MRPVSRRAVVLLAALPLLFLPAGDSLAEAIRFEDYFRDETLRIDYFHTGDATEEIVSLDQMCRQGIWAGSRTRTLDELELGRYQAKVYDAATGRLIHSRGFDSYFGEWRTTSPAAAGVRRTYHESALIPFPLAPIRFTLEVRRADDRLEEVFAVDIDPASFMIRRDPLPGDVIVVEGANHGDSHARVDVAIVGEGYTGDEVDKFRADVERYTAVLLGHEPYRSLAEHFNVWGVLLPSQESGCDEPSRGVHRRTSLGCTFDSLGSERYMLTEDNRAIRDVAGHVPYDVLYVMVNHERYGGGGIYNLFCTFTSDNQWSPYVFLHEFGHSFAGLAEEYYTSSTAYNDFYPRGVEPNERNITALLDPGGLKWGDLATPDTPLPTPWNKDEYDAMDREYQERRRTLNERIAALMREGTAPAEIEAAVNEGEEQSLAHQQRLDAWFAGQPERAVVGAFEGAGYMSRGLYRSQLDCIMFTKGVKPFCAACRRGIGEVIARYGE